MGNVHENPELLEE
ncbi:hypothetical protein HPB53_07175 [Lactiplantibacillus plantarum]|nr:hypothetical protein HPB53_07175 [Lactiplantibacillus plantarum]